jgi:DNA-binding YbaB/EbfC family protein
MTVNPLDVVKNMQKIQEQLKDFREKLADVVVTGSAAGGMVEVDMNGKMEVLAVRIAQETVADIEMLEDLIVSACAAAQEKIQASIQGEAGSIAQSMGMPPAMFNSIWNS